MKNIIVTLIVSASFLFTTSCDEYLEVPLPVDQLATESVFKSKPAIEATVLGIYNAIAGLTHSWDFGYLLYLSDEIYYPAVAGSRDLLAIANIDATNSQVTSWSHHYIVINRANIIIENLPDVPSNVLTTVQNNTYMGEAKYLRAYSYWFMANFWGDVPLVLTSGLGGNLKLPRAPVNDVYDQIIKDLEDAVNLLPAAVSANSSRIHNKYQAEALLARVYLYRGLWSKAEAAANNVISNSGYYQLLPNLSDVFKRNSRETIFSLRESSNSSLFLDKALMGAVLISDANCAMYPAVVSKFEAGDARFAGWTRLVSGRRQPFKYIHALTANAASNPQDFVIQRLAEMFLVRAEARANQGSLTGPNGAIADINTIRTRAVLANTSVTTQAEVLAAIEDERIRELFAESHRWFDLKRTNKADQILGALPHKAANYKPYMKFMPISTREIESNPSLLQTDGYK